MEADALDDIYNEFIQILLRYYNMSFPLKYIKFQNYKKYKWISETISKAKQTLNLLHKSYLQNTIEKQTYVNYKNYYTKLLRQEKAIFYRIQKKTSDNKSRTIWNIINTESGKNKSKKQIFKGFSHNNV